jgi:hypothetical protein
VREGITENQRIDNTNTAPIVSLKGVSNHEENGENGTFSPREVCVAAKLSSFHL